MRGIDADIRWNSEGSFHKDELPDLRADYILANPPFNISDWGGERLREDPRWKYGIPPAGNANFGWLQHILHHLGLNGTTGVVLANGSMSSSQSGEGDIRKAMIEGGVVDCMIALPGQLFYSTQIPACLWFLAKNKQNGRFRDRSNEILFIDARKLGVMVDRTRREFVDADIAKIVAAYHRWREGQDYEDVPGFCKSAELEEIRRARSRPHPRSLCWRGGAGRRWGAVRGQDEAACRTVERAASRSREVGRRHSCQPQGDWVWRLIGRNSIWVN